MRRFIYNVVLVIIIKYLREEGEMMMAMLWAQKIMYGKKTFAEVPAKLKEQVREILIESGMEELIVE